VGKGKQEWVRACRDAYFHPQKFNIPIKTWFVSKMIIFKKPWNLKMP
jgi:hypothetical protein